VAVQRHMPSCSCLYNEIYLIHLALADKVLIAGLMIMISSAARGHRRCGQEPLRNDGDERRGKLG